MARCASPRAVSATRRSGGSISPRRCPSGRCRSPRAVAPASSRARRPSRDPTAHCDRPSGPVLQTGVVAQLSDIVSGPVGPEIGVPRWTGLEDGHVLASHADFEADLISDERRNLLLRPAPQAHHVELRNSGHRLHTGPTDRPITAGSRLGLDPSEFRDALAPSPRSNPLRDMSHNGYGVRNRGRSTVPGTAGVGVTSVT
jgi:hypothetical protein